MKKLALLSILVFCLAGCATPIKVYEIAALLTYDPKPSNEKLLKLADAAIRMGLKDPDSLKNLKIIDSYKCYASKMGITDNVSPKYDYGYWCYALSYQATDSYGGYVSGSTHVVYWQGRVFTDQMEAMGEIIRKSDDIWTYHSM